MKKVFLFLTTGFEEIEALAVVDVLRRGGVDMQTVSLTGLQEVTGSHGITVKADVMFALAALDRARMMIIPGGTVKFNEHEGMKKQIVRLASEGGLVAAICAAPMVLSGLGLLEGRRATCYPGYEGYLRGAAVVKDGVVVDGNITTGRGPGVAIEFGLALLAQLEGKDKADAVKGQLVME